MAMRETSAAWSAARPAAGQDTAGRNPPATAAVVLGAAGLFTSIAVVGGLLGVTGLITGALGVHRARSAGTDTRRAVIGLVLSFGAVAVSVVAAALLIWYADHTQECYQPDSFDQYVECVRRNLSRS